MKKQLLLAGALLSILQANAQSPLRKQHASSKKNHELLTRVLHSQSISNTAQKPTEIRQRVIAQATELMLPGNSLDSTTFHYNGLKGSTFDWNSLNYSYNSDFNNLYDPLFRFPGQDNPMNMLADSISIYSDDELTWYANARYRTDNKIDSLRIKYNDGSGNFLAVKDYNSYNAQGVLVKTFNLQELTPGDLDTFLTKSFSYNSTYTRIERDSTWISFSGSTELAGITTYHYSNNKLDSIRAWDIYGAPLTLSTTIKLTYNSNGKISTLKSYDHFSGSPVLSYADTIGYTSGVDYMTFFQEDYYDEDGVFTDGTREIKYVGANGLPDSVRVFQREDIASGYEYFASLLTSYNSFHNPETFYIKFDMTGTDTAGRFSFYYETWDDGLSVKPVAENKDFNVYPNPFSSDINIDWKGKQQSNVTVRMINIIGQEVYQTSIKLNAGKNQFQVPSLNSGNYILLIQDANGKTWSTKMVKQ